jgi:hypothetical protein
MNLELELELITCFPLSSHAGLSSFGLFPAIRPGHDGTEAAEQDGDEVQSPRRNDDVAEDDAAPEPQTSKVARPWPSYYSQSATK